MDVLLWRLGRHMVPEDVYVELNNKEYTYTYFFLVVTVYILGFPGVCLAKRAARMRPYAPREIFAAAARSPEAAEQGSRS